jgi:hypothetical protein
MVFPPALLSPLRPAVRAAFGCLYQRRQILATTTYCAWVGKAESAMRENHRTGHESMVGPCGLEPQTSTVSIWRPHDYRPLLIATKCKCVKKMPSLLHFHDSQSYVVNFGDKTRSMLNCVFNSVGAQMHFWYCQQDGCFSRHSLCCKLPQILFGMSSPVMRLSEQGVSWRIGCL